MNDIDSWSVEKSKLLYGIHNWGTPYFSINDSGHISVTPDGNGGPAVDLYDLVRAVKDRGIQLPVLFRFNGILRHRVRTIHEAFNNAIREEKYQGQYFLAYPIKVNQQRHIVDVLREAGSEYSMGLEVGSKPELIAVLALQDKRDGLLLCNGYKDTSYVELALMSRKAGRRPIITIEKYSELELVLNCAEALGVEPEIGFRLRSSGKGAGRWERSGGDRAKFGLSMAEILDAVNELEKRNMLHAVKLLHAHIGSQLTSITALRSILKELTQVYVQLRKRCPELSFIDIGGGLAVDYDGSRTTFESSMNYTVEEYARDVIWVIGDICAQAGVPDPNIITESGRATVAHHSLLVFNVLGIANSFSKSCNGKEILERSKNPTVHLMAHLLMDLTPKNCQESLHDAISLRTDMLQQFNLGLMSLEDRALGDESYWAVLHAISRMMGELPYVPEDLERLPSLLSDTYFCNFSVFQSLPDLWAIQQIFPITPVHRLNEEPTRPVVLADITCDSDGKIDRFADLRDVKRHIMVHELRQSEDYYFAAFLIGAYQEILGDLHNLFGDTNTVHVEVTENGKVEIPRVIVGDNVREVLRYVQYDKEDLCQRWRNALEQAVSEGSLAPHESGEMYQKYAQAFEGYTYLTSAK